jgi:hypothetical protein
MLVAAVVGVICDTTVPHPFLYGFSSYLRCQIQQNGTHSTLSAIQYSTSRHTGSTIFYKQSYPHRYAQMCVKPATKSWIEGFFMVENSWIA